MSKDIKCINIYYIISIVNCKGMMKMNNENCKFEKGKRVVNTQVFYDEWIKINDEQYLLDIINETDNPVIDKINYIAYNDYINNIDIITIYAESGDKERKIRIPFDDFVSLIDNKLKLNEIAFGNNITDRKLSVVDIVWDDRDRSLVIFYRIYKIDNIKLPNINRYDFINHIQELPTFIDKYRVLDFCEVTDQDNETVIVCKVTKLNEDNKLSSIILDKDDLKDITKNILVEQEIFEGNDEFEVIDVDFPSITIMRSID